MPQQKPTQFTFPITLLKGGFYDVSQCLDDICFYTLYAHARRCYGSLGSPQCMMAAAGQDYGMHLSDAQRAWAQGEALYVAHRNQPLATIPRPQMEDYSSSYKDEFEVASFLGWAALTSILRHQPWVKTTKAMIHARMCGYPTPARLRGKMIYTGEIKYSKRYNIDKLLRHLEQHWGLRTFSHHTQGIYFSLGQMSYSQLALISESQKNKPAGTGLQQVRLQGITHAHHTPGNPPLSPAPLPAPLHGILLPTHQQPGAMQHAPGWPPVSTPVAPGYHARAIPTAPKTKIIITPSAP